ncbi:exported hypothetical protein [Candidatus Sulfopaludibacter sp. SbA4]|nr:exported hypothetical protein [Candidatus Sulfopaludibacter sp. SbA4]
MLSNRGWGMGLGFVGYSFRFSLYASSGIQWMQCH